MYVSQSHFATKEGSKARPPGMEIINLPIDELIEYENNPRINDEAVEPVARSIEQFGFKVPIVVDSRNVIIAGHTRLKAARFLGLDEVPCIIADDLTEDQVKAFRLADNKVGEIAQWDFDLLNIELGDIEMDMSDFGFMELEDVEIELGETAEEEPPVPEEVPTRCKEGDVWRLGDHRLICGDSTDRKTIDKVMDGDKADLLLTDPPYNVALGSHDSAEEARQLHRRTDGLLIANDSWENDEDFVDFLASVYGNCLDGMKEGAAFYIWHASNQALNFLKANEKAGMQVRQTIIWNKNTFTLGRQDYQWKHEPCLYGWKAGAAHHFVDDRKQSTVWDFDKPSRSADHPTMKPVALMAKSVENSTKKGGVVIDPFGGSGSTLLACEQTGRKCRTAELSPRFCDVIIRRWEEMTGKEAERI